ncbi:MAG: O-antigen ligase [Flavobacterium sp.]|nr:O-antigen ligase [Flavobacterium sp.]
MNNIIKTLLLILLILIVLFWDDFYSLAVVYFYFCIGLLIIDIYVTKTIKLIHVWNGAFVYIILSEVFLYPELEVNKNALFAIQYLIIANNMILLGYYSRRLKKVKVTQINAHNVTASKSAVAILVLLVGFFVVIMLPTALKSFALGREAANENESGFVFSSVVNAMGFVLPSVIAFYFLKIRKMNIIFPILMSSPVFIILFMSGSRFPLLFSVVGFLITSRNLINANNKSVSKVSFKSFMIAAVFSGLLLFVSNKMKDFRSVNTQYKDIKVHLAHNDLPTKASQYFSEEGIVDMTILMFNHFSHEDYLYGKSTLFITYFWVPRQIWKDKPTMLGNWFIRMYRAGFSDGHSASFGFTGDLYADFGYFSLFFIFFIGRGLKAAERYKDVVLKSGNYNLILGAMLFPFIFFFVRSPITSSMTFLGILAFYFLIKRIIFKEVKI